jgi:hypothetical protein
MGKNHHQELRHKIWFEAAVYTKREFYSSAVATEISSDGIRIETAKAIPPATQVVILLQLLQEQIELRGDVEWTLSNPREGINLYQMGVRTNAILFQETTAVDFSERSEVVQEILYKMKLSAANKMAS